VGDTIARYGGEEFVVLLPQTAGHHAREIAERIRATIAGIPLHVQSGHEINVTISIGLSMLKTDESSGDNKQVAERLLAAADSSLYQAKNTGRNRVVCDDSQPLNSTQGPGWAQALQQLRVRAGSLLRVAHGTVVGLLKNLMQA
jgi:predicted signal transduction protein with EAL and GGDEF domain